MKTFNLFLTVIMSLLLSTSVSAVHISTRKDPPSHHYIKESEMNGLQTDLQIAFLGKVDSTDERLLCFNDKRRFNIENVAIANINTIKEDRAIELACLNDEKDGEFDATNQAYPAIYRHPKRGSSYLIPLINIRRVFGFDLCNNFYEDMNKLYFLSVNSKDEYIAFIFSFRNHNPYRRVLYQTVQNTIYKTARYEISITNYLNDIRPLLNTIFDGYIKKEYAKDMSAKKEKKWDNIVETFAFKKPELPPFDKNLFGIADLSSVLDYINYKQSKIWKEEMNMMEMKWTRDDLNLVLREKMLNAPDDLDDGSYHLMTMGENFKYRAIHMMENLGGVCIHKVIRLVISFIKKGKMDLAADVLKLYSHVENYKKRRDMIKLEYLDKLP